MKLFKKNNKLYLRFKGKCYTRKEIDFNWLINRVGLHDFILNSINEWDECDFPSFDSLDPPLGNQEIWAAGVTYMRSREARMHEAKDSGGDRFYDMVYYADRPELFYKGNHYRCAGHNQIVHIRDDSYWNVPEPELTLFISSLKTIEGYTIGNDMSSRSIEGENPLYLPQAKVYNRSSSLGPCLYIPKEPISPDTLIKIKIIRNQNNILYQDQVSISKMKRKPMELADYLFRNQSFDDGVFLMTGTCLVPDEDFTLSKSDKIEISIENIGTLVNFVTQKSD